MNADAWEVALQDVDDTTLMLAVRAFIQSDNEFWPRPATLRKHIPNPTADADREACETAFYGARALLPPSYRKACDIADIPSAFTIRRMDSADVAKLRARFLKACQHTEVLTLAKATSTTQRLTQEAHAALPTTLPRPSATVPRKAAETPAREQQDDQPTHTAPPPTRRKNPDDVSVEECLRRRPAISVYQDQPHLWPSVLRTTQVMIAEGRL